MVIYVTTTPTVGNMLQTLKRLAQHRDLTKQAIYVGGGDGQEPGFLIKHGIIAKFPQLFGILQWRRNEAR
jgi:hypothetical protein